MAKGAEAKNNLINKIIKDNPDNYIGLFDKKYYFWAQENSGEKVQIAISMTCPKVPVEATNMPPAGEDFNFEDMSAVGAVSFTPAKAPTEISEEEKDNIAEMMKKLGL